ncbi:DUF1345 domain-containing protein [Amycolatopsis jiangsuensis]|uniref:Putative membrane protein n=1 Tax=Amycolatopsis jiangsuensis TaxID=1181879 RepID=A0A840J644_9PSEU|nr:DUF1345 domain-containing protein [Amycolatopsis jiangsuensis]MBB4689500.1 putative membrane protein [Amycolatopsis jiangsuensis]
MRRPNRESTRQLLALPPALLGLLVPGGPVVKVLAVWDVYSLCYLGLVWLAFRGRDHASLRAVALEPGGRRATTRWFVSRPEQVSQSAAGAALLATVLAMPQARTLGTAPGLVLAVCILAVFCSWLVLQAGFVIAYVNLHAREGGLDFPGDEEPVAIDFLYFAVSVGTTFGTTDVTVTHRRMRRHVLVHGVLAFFFNTLILAAALTILTSYIAAS